MISLIAPGGQGTDENGNYLVLSFHSLRDHNKSMSGSWYGENRRMSVASKRKVQLSKQNHSSSSHLLNKILFHSNNCSYSLVAAYLLHRFISAACG